jgi:hypothetical protein
MDVQRNVFARPCGQKRQRTAKLAAGPQGAQQGLPTEGREMKKGVKGYQNAAGRAGSARQ